MGRREFRQPADCLLGALVGRAPRRSAVELSRTNWRLACERLDARQAVVPRPADGFTVPSFAVRSPDC